jgi:cell division protein FtsB
MKPRDATRRFFSRPLGQNPFGARRMHIPRWLWLALGIWLAWVTVISEHSFWRISQLRAQVARAERDTKRIKDDTEKMQAQVKDPVSKRFRAEEIARTEHGWAAPGEIVYRFRGDQPVADSTR